VEVRPGQTLIGRHETCHIVIDDPLASRRHACISWEFGRLTIEDLGSVNGVLLNGKRIDQATEIVNGDELRLGNQRIDVFMTEQVGSRPRHAATAKTLVGERSLPNTFEDQDESTTVRDGEALTTLALVAERTLAMGRGADAERILDTALNTVRGKVRRSEGVDAETIELAANCAVRLAEATHKGSWVDFAVELYATLGLVLPGTVVDRLYGAVRAVDGTNVDRLRSYIEMLGRKRGSMGPGDLFLLRRLEGLERLFALK
jgi:pSer/pThr/pTyr-binding forkhead associated (FHA) protein